MSDGLLLGACSAALHELLGIRPGCRIAGVAAQADLLQVRGAVSVGIPVSDRFERCDARYAAKKDELKALLPKENKDDINGNTGYAFKDGKTTNSRTAMRLMVSGSLRCSNPGILLPSV